MPSLFKRFDRSQLSLRSLKKRRHLLDLSSVLKIDETPSAELDPRMIDLAQKICRANEKGAPTILFMGAHLLRAGVARYIIRMMEQGLVTHVAMNGAGPIHDFEMALIGATTESVADYIQKGQFGLWEETGEINRIVSQAVNSGQGFGEGLGEAIARGSFPHKEISILAAGYRLAVPVTIHVGIGYDIIHEHPSCDGCALGVASYDDFLILAETVRHLEGGVVLNFGTAVMGPEVFLKALSMARNVAAQEGKSIRSFTTAVFDLITLDPETSNEPSTEDPRYYFRPWKTLLVRTVAEAGQSIYFQGDHRLTFPALYQAILSIKGVHHREAGPS